MKLSSPYIGMLLLGHLVRPVTGQVLPPPPPIVRLPEPAKAPAKIWGNQPPPTSRVTRGLPRQDRGTIRSLTKLVDLLDVHKLRPTSPGSWEDQNIRVGIKLISFLSLDLDDANPLCFTTSPPDLGDVLVTRLPIAQGKTLMETQAIWIVDEASVVNVLVELRPETLDSTHVDSFVEKLFRWDDLTLRSVELFELTGGARTTEQWQAGIIDGVKSSAGNLYKHITTVRYRDKGFAIVTATKTHESYPLGGAFVTERFPPLRDRLRTMSRVALLEELGDRPEDRRISPGLRHTRDVIVLRELLARTPLSRSELETLIFTKASYLKTRQFIDYRFDAVLDAIEFHGLTATYKPLFEAIFERQDALSVPSFGPSILAAAARSGADYSALAIAFIRQGRHVRASLRYLKNEGKDANLAAALSSLQVAPEYREEQETTLRALRARHSSQ